MRAARTSLLLVAFALLASALHLTLALPAEIAASEAAAAPAAEEAASETVSQRDPEEHPAPAAPAFHLPRPSEIIHAVGSYVHGAHQQHAQEHHEEVHEQVAEHHEQHHEHHEQHHPTTHRPHHRPPHRPLHPEKEKIKVTKTVLVEFTKLVTRHPVCMKVYGVKPPCLPFQAYSASGAQHGKPCNHGGIRENDAPTGAFDDEEEGVYADAELKEGLYISPSAVAEMPAATNIVEAPEDLEAAARSARYLELRAPAAPASPAPVAAPASATPALPVEQSGRQHLIAAAASAASSAADNAAAGVGGLLGHRKPEKIVEYKTLWVTKVEKVWDHRVTATLVAENCVPTDLKIPFCGAGYGPTFEGGDEIVYKPVKPAHKPIHKPVHKPVHHEPVHKPVHHEPVHKPVHHEPVHKPVHHEPVHKPVHHEPVHKPVHHEPEHKPVHHEPVHKPVHHEPVHKPVHHEPVHKPVHKPEVEKPGYIEYSETEVPVDHHWKEGEDEVPAQEEAVAQASVENEAEEKPAFD